MWILERVALLLLLNECIRDQLGEVEADLSNLQNALQYVHTNFLLYLDVLHTVAIQKNAQDAHSISEVISTRTKQRKLVKFANNKQERCQLIANNNEIVFSILKLALMDGDDSPETALQKTVSTIFNRINTMAVAEATNVIMQTFRSIISDLEKKLAARSKTQTQNTQQNATPPVQESYPKAHQLADKVFSVKPPFLPPLAKNIEDQTYTLVLDLDETLIHCRDQDNNESICMIRPYAQHFIEEMANYFEVVIFTAALREYAFAIIPLIDPKNKISAVLTREHTTPYGMTNIKDLSKLGRDLSKTIIVDNLAENFKLQHHNGIMISEWTGDAEDRALLELGKILKRIPHNKKYPDVRLALESLSNQVQQNLDQGIDEITRNLTLDD